MPTDTQTTERRANAPMAMRDVALRPGTWNEAQRTLDVVWTTGARGAKFDWASFDYVDEELATGAANVRLDRLNGGAAVLNTHKSGDLASQIGVVVPGSARMERGEGIATIQLSARDDLAPIVTDIAAGIIRNLSVGYIVHAYEIEQHSGQRPLWRAVDWEPFEISFVPVPFDAMAQVRSSAGGGRHPCIIRTRSTPEAIMPATDTNDPSLGSETRRAAGGPAPIARLRQITDIAASSFGLSPDACASLALDMAERGLSEEEARNSVMQILAERQRVETGGVRGGPSILAGEAARALIGSDRTFDNPAFHSRAIEDALYARMSGTAPAEAAREFMGMSMVQIAGQMLERQGVRGVSRMTPNDVLNAATWNRVGARAAWIHEHARSVGGMHTTSDFPDLLTASGQRFLLDIFAAAASPLKTVGRQRTARDFRAISGLQLSGFGTLPEVLGSGEIKHGTFQSRKETYAMKTFAKQFALSRQAIINDDLGAFGDPIRIMARASAETEASLLADLINSNPDMADAQALFSTDHGNLAAGGAAPDVTTLSDARLAMRSQKDLDGVTPINAAPKYILSSPKLETVIEKLISTPLMPAQIDNTNPFAGKLSPLIDPRLNPNPWYLFADPANAPVLEYAYLDGQAGPHIEMQEGWNTLGQAFRVYMDFGAGLVDHRGAYKNPGTV